MQEFPEKEDVLDRQSNVSAIKFETEERRTSFLKKAVDKVLFTFGNNNRRNEMATVEKAEDESEYSQDFVLTGKPGETLKKRWMVTNIGNLVWPEYT